MITYIYLLTALTLLKRVFKNLMNDLAPEVVFLIFYSSRKRGFPISLALPAVLLFSRVYQRKTKGNFWDGVGNQDIYQYFFSRNPLLPCVFELFKAGAFTNGRFDTQQSSHVDWYITRGAAEEVFLFKTSRQRFSGTGH